MEKYFNNINVSKDAFVFWGLVFNIMLMVFISSTIYMLINIFFLICLLEIYSQTNEKDLYNELENCIFYAIPLLYLIYVSFSHLFKKIDIEKFEPFGFAFLLICLIDLALYKNFVLMFLLTFSFIFIHENTKDKEKYGILIYLMPIFVVFSKFFLENINEEAPTQQKSLA